MQAARRFADQTSSRFADVPGLRAVIATVSTVTAGASPGGHALVTVSWRGQVVTAKGYFASYTPAATDRVLCLLVDDQLIVVGTIAD